jgi:hypothetical protein
MTTGCRFINSWTASATGLPLSTLMSSFFICPYALPQSSITAATRPPPAAKTELRPAFMTVAPRHVE